MKLASLLTQEIFFSRLKNCSFQGCIKLSAPLLPCCEIVVTKYLRCAVQPEERKVHRKFYKDKCPVPFQICLPGK